MRLFQSSATAVLLGALVLSATGCGDDDCDLVGSLLGKVEDRDTGDPIEGIVVTAQPSGQVSVTDEGGDFFFDNLGGGSEITLTAEGVGYLSNNKVFTCDTGFTSPNLDVALKSDFEPNNSKADAATITEGISTAYLGRNRGETEGFDLTDWYQFGGLSEGDEINLTFTNTTDPTLRALDSIIETIRVLENDTEIWAVGSPVGVGGIVSAPEFAATAGSSYFLEFTTGFNNAIEYTVDLSVAPADTGGGPEADCDPENDLAAGACAISTSPIQGNVGPETDLADWYRFLAPANGYLEISVLNRGVGTTATLSEVQLHARTGDNELVRSASVGAGSQRSTPVVPVTDGESYFVRIAPSSAGNFAPYTVAATFTEELRGDTGEDDDSRETAQPIVDDQTIQATLGFDEDMVDWFVFDPDSNGYLNFSVENVTSSDEHDRFGQVNVYVGSDDDFLVQGNAWRNPGETASTARIPVDQDRLYYIEIPEYRTISDQDHLAVYEVTALFEAETRGDFGEDDDTRQAAQSILDDQTIQATLGFGGDMVDWFVFDPDSNGYLNFSVENVTSSDEHDRFGQVNVYVGSDDDFLVQGNAWRNPGETASTARVPVDQNRLYYIEIPEYRTISDRDHLAVYEVTALFEAEPRDDSGEDDDTRQTAQSILDDQTIQATLGFDGDIVDWFVFDPDSNGYLSFTVENLTNSDEHDRFGQVNVYVGSDEDFLVQGNAWRNPGETATTARIPVDQDRLYYIEVPEYRTANDRDHLAVYQVTALFNAELRDDFGEDDDTRETAQPIANDQTVQATLGFDGDPVDWFVFDPDSSGFATFSIENLTNTDEHGRFGQVLVYEGSSATPLAQGNAWRNPGETASISLVPVAADSLYYIEVPEYRTNNDRNHLAVYEINVLTTAAASQ